MTIKQDKILISETSFSDGSKRTYRDVVLKLYSDGDVAISTHWERENIKEEYTQPYAAQPKQYQADLMSKLILKKQDNQWLVLDRDRGHFVSAAELESADVRAAIAQTIERFAFAS